MSHAALIDFGNEQRLPGLPVSGGGDGGGNMTEDLALRVGKLEQDIAVMRQDVNTLTIRSENFATKVDIANICTEMATMRGELREEMTAMRGELKEEMTAMRGELREEMTAIRGELREEMTAIRGELREEMTAIRGELREEMTAMRGEFKGEMADMRGSFHEELRKAMNRQTVLLLTIIPAMLAAIAAVGAWFR